MKILYIDDDLAYVELTRRSLEIHEAEFDLQTAPTMQDAFLLLATTEYDVILSNYRLPDGTGLDMIKLALEQGITTAIVLVANLEDINTVVSALRAGAVDYVVKQSDYLHRLPIVLRNAYAQTQFEKQKIALSESESKYKALVERFPGVVFLDDFNDDQATRYMSPRIKDLLGYTAEEWLAGEKLWENSLHPEDRERVLAEDERTNEIREPFRIEYRLRRKDGRYIWIREDTYLVSDQTEDPVYWQGILMDITAQKEAQETIKASKGSYRELFNSITQAIYIQDADGRFLDVNYGAATMYGYPREFFIGKTPEVLSAPGKNDLKDLIIKTERAFAGEPQEFKFWGLRSDGRIFPETISLNKGTYFGQDVIIAIAQDITERKQVEENLERQINELSILHAAAIAGTQCTTEDEIIEQVVRITARIYPEVCGVLLLNDKGDTLIPHKSNLGADDSVNWQEGISITKGITGRVVQSGRAIRIGDCAKDADYIETAPEIKSEACVPFWVHDRIIGVFNVESKLADAYDEEDEHFLTTLAGGLGTALEKLRLFKTEQTQRQRETAILELIRTAASSLDL
ncbi:MAG: PAS domain S-box protein, partial [Anaerolineales bacterium]|nr:PAS domain S-box protein [Anaerolineales bacterium]